MNYSAQLDPAEPWSSLSVSEFFSAIDWDDNTAPVHVQAIASGERTLNPGINVDQFFNAIPWDGEQVIAPPPPAAPPVLESPKPSDLSLNDFSQLF